MSTVKRQNTAKRPAQPRPATVARRAEVVRSALDVFGAKGYANGTLIDIAELVDMTPAGILHHFGSKDQLLLEVLSYRDATDVQDLDDQHIPGGIDLFKHLIRTAAANAQRAGIVQAFVVLSAESVTEDHPARHYFDDRYRTLRREIAEAFEVVCAERGVDAPETIHRAAASILAVMDGLQVQWLIDPADVDLAETSGYAIRVIVESVLGPGALDG
ncbi:TetR family transcriptional regulator [Plantibacter flavus]|uniref:TetR/AcrR family transcriptional regulator n=1 Tax=Plantibacter flavus TaxID=150123 RepID=UPI0010C230BA|nr:TetR/AcrR family transcriptional regulator [Plantibacter flavus]TKJ99363.1 TetR family transcriptional regulator [Plantibacter flavus]